MGLKIGDYKVQGQTSGDVAINTLDVEHWGDGSVHYTRSTGEKVVVRSPDGLQLLADALGITLNVSNPGH